MDKRNEFSVRLKKLRKELGYTPKGFAAHLEVSLQSYYGYEKGRTVPSFEALINIAEKCNVTLDWLCGVTPVQNIETRAGIQRAEIARILSELLAAADEGKQIEVRILCGDAIGSCNCENRKTDAAGR